jgi:hypothetical protein
MKIPSIAIQFFASAINRGCMLRLIKRVDDLHHFFGYIIPEAPFCTSEVAKSAILEAIALSEG